jgi:hypothetical protein
LKAMSRIGLRLGWRNHDAICRLVKMAGSQHDRAASDREPLRMPGLRTVFQLDIRV